MSQPSTNTTSPPDSGTPPAANDGQEFPANAEHASPPDAGHSSSPDDQRTSTSDEGRTPAPDLTPALDQTPAPTILPSVPARSVNVVGARTRMGGRVVDYDAGTLKLRRGDQIMVETERENVVATVMAPPVQRTTTATLLRVLRIANPGDLQRLHERQRRACEALSFARERARARGLKIKLFRADVQGGRTVFYFASETRVDFRELVRDLGAQLHSRVELRQVGVRDEAKMVGAIGSCGCELCCSTFLPRFETVSIKMAKHQNLVLNPSKVSGQCGRLKCCLAYEDQAYAEASKALPRVGKRVVTPDGIGRVSDLDIMAGKIRVQFPDAPPRVYMASEVKPLQVPNGSAAPEPVEPEETPPGLPKD